MPFAPHIRATAIGRLGVTSGEGFSYSLNMARGEGFDGIPGLQPNLTALQDVAEDIRAFHARATSCISARAVLLEVKFARIGADGKYTEDPVIVNVADTPGGSVDPVASQAYVPPQSALAISLTTSRRGPTGKGRFYIPMPAIPLSDQSLLMGDDVRDAIQGSAAQLIQDVGNAPGWDVADIVVCVSSTKGYNTEVKGVRVGRAIDTIRSRRRDLPENFDAPTAVVQ